MSTSPNPAQRGRGRRAAHLDPLPLPPPVEEIAAAGAALLADDLLVLFGRCAAELPAEAEARVPGDRIPGDWWCYRGAVGEGEVPFVAVARLEGAARAQVGGLDLTAADGSHLRVRGAARLGLGAGPLAEHLRGGSLNAADAFGFLSAALLQGVGPLAVARGGAFLADLLAAAGCQDGFVEILARPVCGGLLVQGWCARAPDGEVEAVLVADDGRIEPCRMAVAPFRRPDVLAPARGVVAFAKGARAIEPDEIRALYMAAGDGFWRLDVAVAHRVLLEPVAATEHLRATLPRLAGVGEAGRALRRVCRPRFPGVDTVATTHRPVRAAKDLLIPVPGVGLLLSGWLLDPEGHVARVLLKGDRQLYARLDRRWTRRSRPDVGEGYARDTVLGHRLRSDDTLHGFVVLVPTAAPLALGERLYLEFVLTDGDCLFLPVEVDTRDSLAAFLRLLDGVALDEPAFEALTHEHLAPAAGPLLAARPGPRVQAVVAAGGGSDPGGAPEVAVIVPVGPGVEGTEALLACLADDPDLVHAELVLVAGDAEARRLAPVLRRLASFYGVSIRLVALAGAADDVFEAMAAGAAATAAPLLLFQRVEVLPDGPGWLGRLREGLARLPSPGALSPTLVYEDGGPRYAGGNPGVRRRGGDGPLPAPAPAGECLLIERQLFEAVGGFPRDLADEALVPRAFARRLAAYGAGSFWLPGVRLHAPDPPVAAAHEHWRRVAARLGRRALAVLYPELALELEALQPRIGT